MARQNMISEFQGDDRYLSNFWIAEVMYEGARYPTVEHAYQAAKSIIHEDREIIRRLRSPGEAKRAWKNELCHQCNGKGCSACKGSGYKLGRKLTLRSDWQEINLNLMYEFVKQKFHYADLKKLLLATGDQELQEGNNWGDVFWGICRGKGENHLGKILMRVREELRSE
jgi:N-glycosidase YbiA